MILLPYSHFIFPDHSCFSGIFIDRLSSPDIHGNNVSTRYPSCEGHDQIEVTEGVIRILDTEESNVPPPLFLGI